MTAIGALACLTLGLLLAEGLHTWLARTDARRRRVGDDLDVAEYREAAQNPDEGNPDSWEWLGMSR